VTAPHTVLVAGGPGLFRDAFARVLDDEVDLSLVDVIHDPDRAEEACARLLPAVAVVDGGGRSARAALRACRAIKAQMSRTKVLLTSETEDAGLLLRAVETGIDGFASREDTLAELLDATRAVARGEARIPPRMLGVLLADLIQRRREEDAILERLAALTSRERQVAALLAAGLNRDAVAAELVISPETARTHIQRVLAKLGVHSQLEAAAVIASSEAALRFARTGSAR
jgi:DNA-binding NarL/FixJ family response regulator